jgi:hypothetical protein
MSADLRLGVFTLLVFASSLYADVPVDTSEYRGAESGIDVRHVGKEWRVAWLDGSGGRVTIALELEDGKPLFKWIAALPKGLSSEARVLEAFDPVFFLTVGE